VEPAARAPATPDQAWDWADLRLRAGREAGRLLRDPNEVEDAVQEAMMRAWRQRGSCRSPEAPEHWLRRIARNEAFRQHTRAAARQTDALPDDADPSEAPDDGLVDRLFVAEALGRLGDDERRLVVMRYQLDLPDGAIAERLGVAPSTVRVRLHRLKNKLRVLMGEFR
jgi:RNA polymerase sigma factor (sigma-70 family)